MSKVLVTEDYLSQIANAIRSKSGGSTQYRPGDMAAAILAIPTGGITPTGTKNITQNGTHDVTEFASANVNVPNSYAAGDEGKVVQNGTLVGQTSKAVTSNGTVDTTTNNQVVVSVQPNLQSKTATQNGTVTPDQGYDGLSSVVVNVSGGGGGDDPFALTDYIESSGTQWIDTGYYVKQDSRFELVANINSSNAQFASMFGTRVSSVSTAAAAGAYLWCKYSGSSAIYADFGTGQTNVSVVFGSAANVYDKKTNLILKNGYVGGDISGIQECLGCLLNSQVVPTNQYPIYLFNLDEAGHEYGAATRCSMKLYRFRIYEGSTLVHEFVPWTESGVVCLKDTVTGNLKYNAGTGAFVRGSDT